MPTDVPTTHSLFSVLSVTSSQNQSYVTIDGQSASLSWNKAPIWGLRPDFLLLSGNCGFVDMGALSEERTGLSL
jgi:hypothetical protein